MGNFQTCGPNEVIVVSGCCQGSDNLIIGGRAWIWACGLQVAQRLPLNTITIEVVSNEVNSQQGVPICAVGVAQVKVNTTTDECLRAACQLFLGHNEKRSYQMLEDVARETLEGHQRAIIGNMTVEDMFRDKVKFSEQVYSTASADMLKLGLQIVSYTLKQLTDNNGYLRALGQTEIAETQARQRIAEAENQRDADCRKAEATQLQKVAEFEAELEKTTANMELELRKAVNLKEIGIQNAKADLAERLQDAITRQEVVEQEMQIKVVERQREIKVQEEEIKRVEQQLQSSIIKPAEADMYRIQKTAEAEKMKLIAEAQAEADAIRLRGEAEAFAIEERAKAEAEQLKKKAEAFRQYKEAALVDVVLKIMPQVAAEIAAPINNAKKINMIASGDGDVGAARVANEVLCIMERLPAVVKNMTGIDITDDLQKITANSRN